MKSPSAALIWEIWRKNRWPFAVLILILTLCAGLRVLVEHLESRAGRLEASVATMGEKALTTPQRGRTRLMQLTEEMEKLAFAKEAAERWRQAALGWSILMVGFSGLVVFAIFGSAEPNSLRGFTGIPPRKFTLPVSTAALVAWPMTLGAVAIVLLHFAWSRLVINPLLLDGITVSDAYHLSLGLAGLAGFQAIVWGLPSFPKTRAGFLTALILGLVALTGMPVFMQQGAQANRVAHWLEEQPRFVSVFAVVWLLSVLAAFYGVSRERCGAWSNWKCPGILSKRVKLISVPSLDFLGPLHAQFWIEWRRNGRLAVALWILVLLLCLAADTFIKSLDAPWVMEIEGIVPVAFIAWGALAGLNLGRDGGSKKLTVSPFMATRPMTTGAFVAAKIMAGLAIWGMAALAFVVWAVVNSVLIPSATPEMIVGYPDIEADSRLGFTVIGLVVSLSLFVGILPLCLTGRIPGFPWSLFPLLVVYGLLFNAYAWFKRHGDSFEWMFGLLALVLTAKLILAFWGFRRSLRLRLITPWFVIACLSVWCAGTTVLFVLILGHGWQEELVSDVTTLLPAAALAIPLARLGLSPLALAMNRHR